MLELAAQALPAVAAALPTAPRIRAHCEDLVQRLGPERAEWSAALAMTFDRLLARAIRIRNAVLHGGAVQAIACAMRMNNPQTTLVNTRNLLAQYHRILPKR